MQLCIYIYIYITYLHIYIYIYIYTYREREETSIIVWGVLVQQHLGNHNMLSLSDCEQRLNVLCETPLCYD